MDLQTDCLQRAADLATALDIKDLDKALLTGNPDWKAVMDVVFQLYRLGNTTNVWDIWSVLFSGVIHIYIIQFI